MNRIPDRILLKCMPVPESGCLVWLGETEKGGYGQVWWKGGKRLIHRVIYELIKGPIPKGMVIDHLCRVRSCISTDHLEVVTHRQNILRSTGLAAQNSVKTQCRNGHPFSGENTYVYPNGERSCRACGRAAFRKWYERKRKLKLLPL